MQTQIIEVQTVRNGIAGKVSVVQNDSARILKCVLTDYVIPTVAIARIYARKPSGAVVYNDCVIVNNTIEVELTNQMLAETGLICCQIELTEVGKTLTTFEFQIDVKRQLKDNNIIESSNEFTALEDALNYYLPVEGETVSGLTSFSQGIRGYTLSSSASHGKGWTGWSHAFKITTTGVYQNQFMKFSIVQRNRMGKMYIRLVSNITAGTVNVGEFCTVGNIKVAYVCEDNVLDVYIYKSEAYDEIDCMITQKGSYMNGTVITWVDTVVSTLPEGAVAAISNTNDTFTFTASRDGGTALVLDNTNSSDDRTYVAFKNKGQAAGYLSMSDNDLYTYKNGSNCKVLDSKNYTTVLTDYMRVLEVPTSIKLKVPITKTTDTANYYAGMLNHTIKVENSEAVALSSKNVSSSSGFLYFRTGSSGSTDISYSVSNIVGTSYIYLTLTNKHTSTNVLVEFPSNSGISVESIS